MKRQVLLFFLLLFGATAAIAQTSLEGRVKDATTGEPLMFAGVTLFQNGVMKTSIDTDENGFYRFANLDPGTYSIEVTYVGYATQRQNGILVIQGKINSANIKLDQGVTITEVVITDYAVPLIQQDNTSSGAVVTGEQIRNSPLKSIASIATTTAGLTTSGDDLNVRGSRGNATNIYVDGIRVIGSNANNIIPQSEVDQLQIVTGGLEAAYGDVTGGVVSITTKGPSNRFSGGLELETSKFLDPYNRSEINGNLSGPILRNKNKESILGFRVSGRYLYNYDDNPSRIGVYRMPADELAKLKENPVTRIGGFVFPSAEFLDNDNIELLDARPNERAKGLDFNGKIDSRVNEAIDFSLSAGYRNTRNRFAPAGNESAINNGWSQYNWEYNPEAYDDGLRSSFRFRHRLGVAKRGEEGTEAKKSFIQNAVYTLQAGYERTSGKREDIRHGQNPFRYGHVGTFRYNWVPVAAEVASGDTTIIAHADWSQVIDEANPFTGSTYNPILANYNDLFTPDIYPNNNGLLSSSYNQVWTFQSNVGNVYNRMAKYESNIYSGNAAFSFDILPGGSEKGKHSIQFGLLYEQRVERNWTLAPFSLWQIARAQANRHINGVDYNNPIGTFEQNGEVFTEYGKLITGNDDLRFYKAVRELTGQALTDFVNVDAINPDDLRLNMFSASELTDQGVLGYSGYDYLGEKKLGTDVSFNDFFKKRNADGTRTFEVAPFSPIYSSAYIQDKFSFKDIIFRLGLRVDRFDANTKVLKDIYSLYEVQNAKDFFASNSTPRPASVQDDYKVYVTGTGSTAVKAYRQGDNWFYPTGAPANDGNVIFGSQVVYPALYKDRVNDIQSDNFNPDNSFEDYTPQVNIMPRVAVSFPISEEANFFAHYDVLSQRPPGNNNVTALDYYYFIQRTPENNPNLLPERTIDYEVGFQQKLSNSSALKLSAYYKELRDMIQSREVLYAAVQGSSYTTYGNIDFGTVKGFQIGYDLRRTGNLSLTANYTIQFADGTGSDANSQRGLTSRGNIRTLFPLNFDERHAIKLVADFRYGSGKRYNGPRWFGIDFLSDFGVNLNGSVVSGRPYTRTQRAVQFGGSGFNGSINGARLPWNFNTDLRVDKNITIGSKSATGRALNLNVYVRVLNLLNTENTVGVYTASGSAEDDGFLATAQGEISIQNAITSSPEVLAAGRNAQAYLDAYYWRMANPGFFSGPRRIFLGAIIEF